MRIRLTKERGWRILMIIPILKCIGRVLVHHYDHCSRLWRYLTGINRREAFHLSHHDLRCCRGSKIMSVFLS
jgi:hypothetical protein